MAYNSTVYTGSTQLFSDLLSKINANAAILGTLLISGASMPLNPEVYQIALDRSDGILKQWNGSAWVDCMGIAEMEEDIVALEAIAAALATTYLGIHATADNATKWAAAAKTVSTSAPSGGADGDIWFVREA